MDTLWKYCTMEQQEAMLRSMHLFDGTDIGEDRQTACLYALSNHIEAHYEKQRIQKRNGGQRILLVPDMLLKCIQRNLLHHVLSQMQVSVHASAYYKERGIRYHAGPHLGQKRLLKLDISDFFTSILFHEVYRTVFSKKYYPKRIGVLLTHLCCYRNYLPQGAPTSPAISNLIMKPFDDSIGKWCEDRGIAYTRYCDDMAFSGDFEERAVRNKVSAFLTEMGFTLNEKKTKVLTNLQKQELTGIVVNEKLQVSKEYRKKLRQEVYYALKYGAGKPSASLLGKINYVLHVNPADIYFANAAKKLLER